MRPSIGDGFRLGLGALLALFLIACLLLAGAAAAWWWCRERA
jgi:hypothetical protein